LNYVRKDLLEQKKQAKTSYLIESKIQFRLKNRVIRKFVQGSGENCCRDI